MRERGHGITHDIPPASRIAARARERKMPTGKIPDRHLTGFLLVANRHNCPGLGFNTASWGSVPRHFKIVSQLTVIGGVSCGL